jgi:hypothetical protein
LVSNKCRAVSVDKIRSKNLTSLLIKTMSEMGIFGITNFTSQ